MDGRKESSPKGLTGLGLTTGKMLLCIQQAKQDGDWVGANWMRRQSG